MQLKSKIKIWFEKQDLCSSCVAKFHVERLMKRITLSKYKDIFILKGGMLIASMIGIGSRTTMDMDATLRGYPLSEAHAICAKCAAWKRRVVALSIRSHHRFSSPYCPSRYSDFGWFSLASSLSPSCHALTSSNDLAQARQSLSWPLGQNQNKCPLMTGAPAYLASVPHASF